MSDAIDAILAREELPSSYRAIAERWWRPLAATLAARRRDAGHPLLVGINGPQGSGKTTLCHFLEAMLAEEHGLVADTLALDDLYLTKAQRHEKATQLHPLFATRGVPGTHEVFIGLQVIGAALSGKEALAPRFSKADDDRVAAPDWRPLAAPIDVLLLEGWCVGARPQADAALAEPVNALEAEEDADGTWRAAVNDALRTAYTSLFAPISFLVMLRPPGFEQVRTWRRLQETKLRARTGGGMDDAALDRFIQHYERLTRHMLETLPDAADLVFDLDDAHEVTGASGPAAIPPPAAA